MLQYAKDLSLNNVIVKECGCLGSCGAGPNAVLIPLPPEHPGKNDDENVRNRRQPLMLHHVATFADVIEILKNVCGSEIDETIVKATELRILGNAAAQNNDLTGAIGLYTKALEINPTHGVHLILSNRSLARLSLGDIEGAIEDARKCCKCCPDSFTTAAVRMADALFAFGAYEEALQALEDGSNRFPEWSKTKEYKDLRDSVKQKRKTLPN